MIWLKDYFTIDKIFLYTGLLGQLCFSARFIVQWIYSEREKKSVMPVAFWYFSLVGGIILLIYAIYLKNPVFIMGQAPGVLIYSRNIYLIKKNKRKEPAEKSQINLNLSHEKIFIKE